MDFRGCKAKQFAPKFPRGVFVTSKHCSCRSHKPSVSVGLSFKCIWTITASINYYFKRLVRLLKDKSMTMDELAAILFLPR